MNRNERTEKKTYETPEITIKTFILSEQITTSDIGGTEEIVVDPFDEPGV